MNKQQLMELRRQQAQEVEQPLVAPIPVDIPALKRAAAELAKRRVTVKEKPSTRKAHRQRR